MGVFQFRRFKVVDSESALKVGTDAVLLGTIMSVNPSAGTMLDIGTGCGVIALIAAQRAPQARIIAIDMDGASVREACANFASSPWPERLEAVCTPLQRFECGQFDAIFSNPPFYDGSLRNPDLREAAARHSVSLTIADICSFSREHLSETGILSVVLPAESEKQLVRTASSFGLNLCRMVRIRTTASKPPRRIVAEFSKHRTDSPAQEELVLQEGAQRSARYRAITEEFYL